MNRIGYKTYFFTSIFLFLLSFFLSGSLDISIHDTYFVVANSHIAILLGIFYLFWAGFLRFLAVFQYSTSKRITQIHYLLTTFFLLAFFVYQLWNIAIPPERIYEDYSVYGEFDANQSIHSWSNVFLVSAIGIWILTQLVFLTAIIFAGVRCLRK